MRAHSFAIRTDASQDIGSGHVMRCLALAEGLAARGARVRFLCRDVPGNMIGRIEGEGHDVVRLAATGDASAAREAEAVAAVLGSEQVDWLIVDHYGLDARFESTLRGHARRIMAIDDLGDRAHDCDLLLDQNLNPEPAARYRDLVGAQTRCLFGPRYALLRPAFATIAPRRRDPVRRILVFFGGADRPNATAKTIAAIARLRNPALAVDVVLGAMRADDGELERLCAALPNCRVWRDADMAALMCNADLAVGAGGTTSWERCAAGLPALAWPIADNQRPVLEGLAAIGAVHVPPPDSVASAEGIARHLNALIDDPALRASMAERARAICDGRGVARVIGAMEAFDISVAAASAADGETLFRWRNHPTIRAVSTQTDPIARADHEQWFKASLARDDRLLLIGRLRDAAIGVVRFDRIAPDVAEISIYLDPERLGHGFGAALLSAGEVLLAKSWPQVRRLTATVKSGNIASERLFENGGYSRVLSTFEKIVN